MHKRCSSIKSKLKEESKFKSQICVKQQANIVKVYPGMELNGQSLEIVEKFCYLDGAIGARWGCI